MNRIFRVIFNKALGANVVVGETANVYSKKSMKTAVAVVMVTGAIVINGEVCAETSCLGPTCSAPTYTDQAPIAPSADSTIEYTADNVDVTFSESGVGWSHIYPNGNHLDFIGNGKTNLTMKSTNLNFYEGRWGGVIFLFQNSTT